MSDFDKKRTGTGTKEWAETTFNIGNGCSHDCRYCYAAANALRFGIKGRRDDWKNESFTANSEITTYPSRKGVVMFPSTHDVTPFYLPRFLRAALLMLDKGNKLLITTKPRPDIMDAMTTAFQGYGGQILFRVTIGAYDPDLTDFWEPGHRPPASACAPCRWPPTGASARRSPASRCFPGPTRPCAWSVPRSLSPPATSGSVR